MKEVEFRMSDCDESHVEVHRGFGCFLGGSQRVIDSWPLYVTIVYTDHHDFEENNVKLIVLLIRYLCCNTNIKMRCNVPGLR